MSTLINLSKKDFFSNEEVKKKFAEILGKRGTSFVTSVLQLVTSNDMLKDATNDSIYQSAMVAATLDLPLNNNLGFAYIVPFNDRKNNRCVAQFQLGYKGYIQLAQRSGQFKTISACPIYEGQIVGENPLTGIEFDFSKEKGAKVVGYAGYFKLLNGFEKTLYMTVDELSKHGKRFSQTYKKGFGLWETDFESMAIKTVLKLLLAKFAPLSVDMQKAVLADQSIINDAETMDVEYVDNTQPTSEQVSKEAENERILNFISDATNEEQLSEVENLLTNDEQREAFMDKLLNFKK